MFGWLFRRKAAPDISLLYADLVAASRLPAPFAQEGVADTFEGRFEFLALVTAAVLERLASLGEEGAAAGQELVDAIFTGLDDALRQGGVSDIAVGKRMKKMAKSFYGRINAYRAATLEGETALRAALARNLYASALAPEAVPAAMLARWSGLRARLAQATLAQLLGGGVLTNEG